jgi:hypothetical protein
METYPLSSIFDHPPSKLVSYRLSFYHQLIIDMQPQLSSCIRPSFLNHASLIHPAPWMVGLNLSYHNTQHQLVTLVLPLSQPRPSCIRIKPTLTASYSAETPPESPTAEAVLVPRHKSYARIC